MKIILDNTTDNEHILCQFFQYFPPFCRIFFRILEKRNMGAHLNETIFLKIKIKTLPINLFVKSQPAFTCSKSTMETPEQYVKSVNQ